MYYTPSIMPDTLQELKKAGIIITFMKMSRRVRIRMLDECVNRN